MLFNVNFPFTSVTVPETNVESLAKKTATAIAEQMLEKNIKKGWDKYIKEA